MRQHERHPFRAIGLMTAISSQLVGSVLVGIFGGRFVDERFSTEPLFLVIGLLLGLSAGVYATIRLIRSFFSGEEK
ncbi:F0F1-type ATP synthase assembly protein I [Anoxybacillus tengchongensis]|uniref:F0F1-type ATP synthase assembly protein I n=1 Tax=Anoxybacillus tengchongensis TaxID=576944 RepID=A0A7W9YPV5_9BACL|nr:AtpZ/AtpI family protein [Anoxybacillus tengchongensis]MBB6176143.1 F0F1-type ATP synthase assembly protein I [Anoxybacillus tengchongensis]